MTRKERGDKIGFDTLKGKLSDDIEYDIEKSLRKGIYFDYFFLKLR